MLEYALMWAQMDPVLDARCSSCIHTDLCLVKKIEYQDKQNRKTLDFCNCKVDNFVELLVMTGCDFVDVSAQCWIQESLHYGGEWGRHPHSYTH
jgi:hypothetical protein